MRLIVDVGNTNVKLAVFEGEKICKVFIERTISHSLIEKIMNIYPTIDMVFSCTSNNAICSSVRVAIAFMSPVARLT